MSAPLLGHNLVRLTYLDEAGIDRDATVVCVAGVIVHGDNEWPEVDRRIVALVEKYIPEADRLGFFFHATDIFHGSGYFDRREPKWADFEKSRLPILEDLAGVIEALHLPIVGGFYTKDKFGIGILSSDVPQATKTTLIHEIAALDCLMWTDRWLDQFSPSELATVIHEDGTPAKPMIKKAIRVLRSDALMAANGFPDEEKAKLGLPLKRIIDTVHFAEKSDARPLQLADLCAFILGRHLKGKDVPAKVFSILSRHLRWTLDWHLNKGTPAA